MKTKRLKLILSALILLFIASSCSNRIETIDIEKSIKNIANTKECVNKRIKLYQLEDYSYSFLSDEALGDLYSTYYSLMYLKNINKEYETPVYNNAMLESAKSIQDIFYISEIFKNDLSEDAIDQIFENVTKLYRPEGYFVIDNEYKSADIQDDDNLLYSTWTACKIINSIDKDYNYNDIKSWLIKYNFNIKDKTNPDTNYFEVVLMYYELCIFLEMETSDIKLFIDTHFGEYERQLMQELGSAEFVFNLLTYMELLDHFDKDIDTYIYSHNEIVNMYENENGIFSISSMESPNPFPVFVFSKYIAKTNLNYDFSKCTAFVLRHQRTDAMFIPYISTDGDLESSFYAYLTRIELGEDVIDELTQFCRLNNDNEYVKYIYLDNLSSQNISGDYILTRLNEISTIENYSTSDADNMILLLRIAEERNILLSEDLVIALKQSIKSTLNQISEQKNKNVRAGLIVDEYVNLSAYLLLDANDDYINKTIRKILNSAPRDNLYNLYYYIKLQETASERINHPNISKANIHMFIDLLERCIVKTNGFSYEYSESSINMISNYYGVYISNYLETFAY